MTIENYKKATPLIKDIGELEAQIAFITTATNIKINVGNGEVGISISTFGEDRLKNVRAALIDTFQKKKEDLEKQLSKL